MTTTMDKFINWFHIKFDRHTHDAKFQIFRGNSHQEINLQVQAELTKTTRELNEMKNDIEVLLNSVEQDRKNMENMRMAHEEQLMELKEKYDRDHKKYIDKLKAELDVAKKQLRIQDRIIRDLQRNVDTNYGKYFRIKGDGCHVARMEIIYSEHTTLDAAMINESPHNTRVAVYSLVDTNDERSIQEMVILMIKKCFRGN